MTATDTILVGAGGHAKAIVEALAGLGRVPAVYVDPHAADWIEAEHVRDDNAVSPDRGAIVIGIGGTDPAALDRRLALLDAYLARGCAAPPLVHPAASVSPSARLDAGAIVLAAAVVQPAATIGRGALINTGAIVEHDSTIGEGAHVAPGAVVLGGCTIGACAMIGAGAVVLPGAVVEAGATVPAAGRHPASASRSKGAAA